MYDLAIIGGMVYKDHEMKALNIYCKEGKTVLVSKAVFPAHRTVDAKGKAVYPGFIDPHVHLHLDLGQWVSADDFYSGSTLAAYGGVTTLIDFLDPIVRNEALDKVYEKRMFEAKDSIVDYTFHCTLGNYHDDVTLLETAIETLGITSIKVFTTYSESNRRCSYDKIGQLLKTKALILAHAEDDDLVRPPINFGDYEASRSETSEWQAVEKLMAIQKKTGGTLYLVHVSSGHSLEKIKSKESGLYLESCPQYFMLDSSLFQESDGGKYLLAPPLRNQESLELMKTYFGRLDTIGTDHCPFMLKEKLQSHPDLVPKGIGSLSLTFPLLYDLFGLELIPKITVNPARIYGLKSKGVIDIGYDADFAIVDHQGTTDLGQSRGHADYSVYKGFASSKVTMTIVRGQIIMSDGEIYHHPGQYIRRRYESHH